MSPSYYSVFAVSALAQGSLTVLSVLSSRAHFQSVVSNVQELVTLKEKTDDGLPERQDSPGYFLGILTMQCIG